MLYQFCKSSSLSLSLATIGFINIESAYSTLDISNSYSNIVQSSTNIVTEPTTTKSSLDLLPSLETERRARNDAFWAPISSATPVEDEKLGQRDEFLYGVLEFIESYEKSKTNSNSKTNLNLNSETTDSDSKSQKNESSLNFETPIHPTVIQYLKTGAEKLIVALHTVAQHMKGASSDAKSAKNKESSQSESDSNKSLESEAIGNGPNFYHDKREELVTGRSSNERAILYNDRESRMARLEKIMRPEVSTLGDVLTLCREAREASSNVRKFDLYENNRSFGPPGPDNRWNKYDFPHRVPEFLIEKTKKMEEIADAVRKEYMSLIMGFTKAIIAEFGNGIGAESRNTIVNDSSDSTKSSLLVKSDSESESESQLVHDDSIYSNTNQEKNDILLS